MALEDWPERANVAFPCVRPAPERARIVSRTDPVFSHRADTVATAALPQACRDEYRRPASPPPRSTCILAIVGGAVAWPQISRRCRGVGRINRTKPPPPNPHVWRFCLPPVSVTGPTSRPVHRQRGPARHRPADFGGAQRSTTCPWVLERLCHRLIPAPPGVLGRPVSRGAYNRRPTEASLLGIDPRISRRRRRGLAAARRPMLGCWWPSGPACNAGWRGSDDNRPSLRPCCSGAPFPGRTSVVARATLDGDRGFSTAALGPGPWWVAP